MSSSSAVLIARISNLTPAVTGDHIRELLTDDVKLRELRLPEPVLWMNCPTGRAEAIGETEEDTKAVFVRLHGAELDGQRLNVSMVRIDPTLPPVAAAERASHVEERRHHHDNRDRHRGHRRSRSYSRDCSRDRGHRHHHGHHRDDHHHHDHHHHDRHRGRKQSRSRSPPSAHSRSPAMRPVKAPRTSETAPVLPSRDAPAAKAQPSRSSSRSRSPVWQ